MNKIQKITLAILGGVETVFNIVSPILLVILWTRYTSLTGSASLLLILVGCIASVFRAIKVGGWLKE
jgi:hypothetical protein